MLLAVAVLQAVRAESWPGSVGFWAALLGALALGGAVATVSRRGGPFGIGRFAPARIAGEVIPIRRTAAALLAFGAMAVLLGMTVFVAGRASYSYAGFERPTELLVYSQTGLETKRMAQHIDRIAAESGKGTEGLRLLVGQSDNFGWQWRWYLRDYTQVDMRFLDQTPLTGPPEADVVLISSAVEAQNAAALAGFTKVGELYHLWWFPNTVYKGISVGDVASGVVDRSDLRGVVDYFFARRLATPMYRSTGVMYVASDLASIE